MPEQLSDARLRQEEQVLISPSHTKESLPRIKKRQKGQHLLLISPHTTGSQPRRKKQPKFLFWPALGGLLVLGLLLLGIVTYSVSNWFNNLQIHPSVLPKSPPITRLNVRRSAIYSDLTFTLINVQSATSFNDDPISIGPAMVRVNLHVTNPTNSTIALTYYDIACLLLPKERPIAPTNLNLSASLLKHTSQTGWIDFPVAKGVQLGTVKLQLGNPAIRELLVTIPAKGPYNSSQYRDHLYHEALTINYFFQGYEIPGYWLTYHLTSVDERDSYNGVETRAGNQFYVLNFSVDNLNNVIVQPGYGYDYIRLELNPNRPPLDNTLPYGFQANAQGITGHVTYSAPVGLQTLNIAFLTQAVAGWTTYTVSL